ncbi:ATP-dependent helicase HepA [Rhizobium sp. PP-WC-2G-219]|nr:ATP-dependent helicase HepA [Rhizobium sp. PP-WC-2G-219]
MFIKAIGGKHASWGVGKLIERSGDICTVEYFDTPTCPTILVKVPAASVTTVTVPEQTRVYYLNPILGAWEIGRLIDDHGNVQIVQFPNKTTRHLNVLETYIRWSKPIVDPTPFLANRINESPRFSEGRTAFARSQINQRAASLGMSAILSSAVDLEAHQIEVVRRILQDPVQRYLLADEVGLGKTIEAGILIRQCTLDLGDDAKITVVVPDVLVDQWRAELAEKFYLGHLLDKNIHVLPMSKTGENRARLSSADMLVVDEAHHLTRSGWQDQNYVAIRAAAISAERVLLLSATPVLHNEASFLAMLHLLDPSTYPLDGIDAFQRRIAARQPLAEVVAGLIPENVMYLDYTIEVLTGLFPDDALLQGHIASLRKSIDMMPPEDDPELIEAINRTRAHLSEIYRLDRRILRHRRRNVVGLTPDRAGANIFRYSSSDRAALSVALDDWRFHKAIALDAQDDAAQLSQYQVFHQILDLTSLYMSSDKGTASMFPSLRETVGDSIAASNVTEILKRPGLFNDRAEALSGALAGLLANRFKCVVFCSDPRTADALAARLHLLLRVPVDRHDPHSTTWKSFNDAPEHNILVCDYRAEEGLNLQGGRKAVVHYDTPFNPNRIEQRLGRVDRYGSGDTVRSVLLVCEDDPVEEAWADYLNDALKLFDRSVASLQYLIDQTVRALIPALFNGGTEALRDLIRGQSGEKGLVELEFKAIDQQDSLDALAAPSTGLVEKLFEIDDSWKQIAIDTALWLEQTLMFERMFFPNFEARDRFAIPFRYRFATGRSHTLLPLQTFMDACAGSVDLAPDSRFARAVKTFPNTFQRRTALSREGRAERIRLLRYGEPLLTGIENITDADDRGRSFALWRFDPSYSFSQAADVFIRFDYLVETDLRPILAVLAKSGRESPAAHAALRRRGDLALAPAFSSIWLDATLTPVISPDLKASLERPYRNSKEQAYRDININAHRWPRLDRFGIDELTNWADHCLQARDAAEKLVRSDVELVQRLVAAERQAIELDYRRLSQLETRSRLANDDGAALLAFERDLTSAMISGIREPHIRLETIGAVFLSGNESLTDRLGGGM